MYSLRNQLLHGGVTCNSSVNRSQISQGAEIMTLKNIFNQAGLKYD
jgi:hypothetical protein